MGTNRGDWIDEKAGSKIHDRRGVEPKSRDRRRVAANKSGSTREWGPKSGSTREWHQKIWISVRLGPKKWIDGGLGPPNRDRREIGTKQSRSTWHWDQKVGIDEGVQPNKKGSA